MSKNQRIIIHWEPQRPVNGVVSAVCGETRREKDVEVYDARRASARHWLRLTPPAHRCVGCEKVASVLE